MTRSTKNRSATTWLMLALAAVLFAASGCSAHAGYDMGGTPSTTTYYVGD
jgi:hypothetical protein